jgi:hypothetical protein
VAETREAAADRLFRGFMATLVLGGTLDLGRPIGGKMALSFTGDTPMVDNDLASHVQLARVRVARKLAPVDLLEPPRASEWLLCALLHDLVGATHPDFNVALRRRYPRRIIDIIHKTLDRARPTETVGQALSVHTWVHRMFEITRTDLRLSWWTGSQTFLGTKPPERLTAWPEIRRVHTDTFPRRLMDLPLFGSVIDLDAFAEVVRRFLALSPLTDLATCGRQVPLFQFSEATLKLISTRGGRTLALRALVGQEAQAVDEALGRATHALFQAKAFKALLIAMEFLGERVLADATTRLHGERAGQAPPVGEGSAAFARASGALIAQRFIATNGDCFGERDRATLLAMLRPLASGEAAQALVQLFQ